MWAKDVSLNSFELSLSETSKEIETGKQIEVRKQAYRDAVIARSSEAHFYELPVFAKNGKKIPENLLSEAIENANSNTSTIPDWPIASLVRTLYLLGDKQSLIVRKIEATLASKKYWVDQKTPLVPELVLENDNSFFDNQNLYFTENHFILNMSSDYLVRQHFGLAIPEDLKKRIEHYLYLRTVYGYTEFFSPIYFGITLGGLLNLYDFVEDPAIREKAKLAVERLLLDNLKLVTENGAFFGATTRAQPKYYKGMQSRSTFWIVAGKGQVIDAHGQRAKPISHYDTSVYFFDGPFISTSDIDLAEVVSKREETEYHEQWNQGYHIEDRHEVHKGVSNDERTFFQISAGYLIGDGAGGDSLHAVRRWKLLGAEGFNDVLDLIEPLLAKIGLRVDGILSQIGQIVDSVIAPYASSMGRPDASLEIYKNQNIALMSAENYFEGAMGAQQFPWVATVEDIAVWTQAGPDEDWNQAHVMFGLKPGKDYQNAHLPLVSQEKNVALISYNPLIPIWLSLFKHRYVALYWPEENFDFTETVYPENCSPVKGWLLGKRNESYIAVLGASATKRLDGMPIQTSRRQYWAVVVGNQFTHDSYQSFRDMVFASECSSSYGNQSWWSFLDRDYELVIKVDSQTIESRW